MFTFYTNIVGTIRLNDINQINIKYSWYNRLDVQKIFRKICEIIENLTILAFLSRILCVFLLSKFVSLIMISRHLDIDIALAISTPSCSLKQDQLQPWLPNTLYNWKEYDLFTWCTTDRLNSPRPLMFPKFYIPYIKYSCMLCLFMIIGANVFFF